jgi:hypothetical protein
MAAPVEGEAVIVDQVAPPPRDARPSRERPPREHSARDRAPRERQQGERQQGERQQGERHEGGRHDRDGAQPYGEHRSRGHQRDRAPRETEIMGFGDDLPAFLQAPSSSGGKKTTRSK